jgi:hypothetical protein
VVGSKSIQNIISCCRLHKEEKGGLCTSRPFFFLETEQEGEGNGRRGGGQAMGAGPLAHGNTQEGGKNREEAEGVRFWPSPRAKTDYEGCPW